MLTKEGFRAVLTILLSMSADVELSTHPSGDIAVKLVDGERFRIRVLDMNEGEECPFDCDFCRDD